MRFMKVELFQFQANKMQLQELKSMGMLATERTASKMDRRSSEELSDALKHTSLSFIVDGCSRVATHEIVESDDSYTQQSQRYVKLNSSDGYVTPKLGVSLALGYQSLCHEMFDLYQEMTCLKDGVEKAKSIDDYAHGIPIEDGRYILPLATKSNIFVTMQGTKIVPFLKHITSSYYSEVNTELYTMLIENLAQATQIFDVIGSREFRSNGKSRFSRELDEILYSQITEKVTLLNKTADNVLRVGLGAVTSTHAKSPAEILTEWEAKGHKEYAEKKAGEVMKRVIGYGHVSTEEHSRITFGMRMSLTCMHQMVRHRLREISHPEFWDMDADFRYITPPTIANSNFKTRYDSLVEKAQKLYYGMQKGDDSSACAYILPNCTVVPVVISANDRALVHMLSDRTCNRAQWEIRDLAQRIVEIGMKENPEYYASAGPKCTKGPCPEGKLSCGHAQNMRERYLKTQ